MITSDEENSALALDVSVPEAIENVAIDNPVSDNPFEALGLAPELLQAVATLGYTEPTAVQQRAIPLALQPHPEGFNDLMVSSQTGSGKTAAFLLPVLHTLLGLEREAAARDKAAWDAKVAEALAKGEPAPKKPRRQNPLKPRRFKPAVPGALVLCPTRELAQQVARDAIDLVRHCRSLRIACVVGGMPYQQQIAQLQNVSLVVATPGRLLDLASGGQIVLDQVRFLVVDEADRMLDLGFADALAEINQLTAKRQQTMMFSATFAPPIQQLAMRVMHDGGARVQKVQVATPQQSHANIRQELYWADSPEHRRRLLDYWLRDPSIDQAIVFACTQIECEQLAEDLQQDNFAAVSLHGALSQALRNRRLKAMRDGKVQILVATDVAARGIDVPTITHVINFGLPMKAEDYTHRIGRTGRAGRDGLAVTLAEFRDRRRLADIEAYTRQKFEPLTVTGLEPTKFFPPITEDRPQRKPGRGGGKPGARHGGARRGTDRGGVEPRGPKMIGGGFKGTQAPDRRRSRGEGVRAGAGEVWTPQRSETHRHERRDERPSGRGEFRAAARASAPGRARAAAPRAKPYAPGRAGR
ncbi:DEAD/DEAH box helicase [Ottowia sp.]|uniref:DEAD/DEAH box helicase n=1 Tax=Ottowia sp. TaxID=1898956 RepID=UPI003A83FAB9